MSFEGTDARSGAFSTAGQVKKLNSFSLVSLYFVAKEKFGDVVSPPCLRSSSATQPSRRVMTADVPAHLFVSNLACLPADAAHTSSKHVTQCLRQHVLYWSATTFEWRCAVL